MNGDTPWKVQCHATNRAGEQCGKWAMVGQQVCRNHGGASPQALASARDRLNGLVPASIDVFCKGLVSDDEKHAFNVARFIYDRATDEAGDPLGMPMPSQEQVAAWLAELEDAANA